MSRVLVCSGIRGLTDALKKVLRPEVSCQEVIEYIFLLFHKNPSLQDYDDQPYTFNDLGLNRDLCLGLNDLGLDTPTEIQVLF